jgi:hypothetical protein
MAISGPGVGSEGGGKGMKVCFLSGLRESAGRGELELTFSGPLSVLLGELCDRCGPELRRRVMDPERPERRSPFVKILVDGEDVRQDDPTLAGTEVVFLFLPIAGG